MIARILEIGIIILVVACTAGVAVRAEDTTPVPTVTPSEIVITDDIQPYFGPLGPGSPLYGLKIALENLDEAFTFNASEKVIKQMEHAELRIAEIKGLLLMNKSVEAEGALDAYFEKMNFTAVDLSRIPSSNTGIAHAYEQHVVHEMVLWDLIQKYPNSTKLWRAYNHTLDLEEKFMEKSTIQIEKRIGQLNKITAKIVQIQERTGERSSTTTPTAPVTTDHGKGQEKQVEKDTAAAPVTTQTTAPASVDNSGNDYDKGKEKNGKGPK